MSLYFPTPPSFTCRSRAQERPPLSLYFYWPADAPAVTILGNPSKYRRHLALVTWACRERCEHRCGAVPGPVTHFIGVLVLATLTYPTTTQRLHAPPTPHLPGGHEVAKSEAERRKVTLCPCHVSPSFDFVLARKYRCDRDGVIGFSLLSCLR